MVGGGIPPIMGSAFLCQSLIKKMSPLIYPQVDMMAFSLLKLPFPRWPWIVPRRHHSVRKTERKKTNAVVSWRNWTLFALRVGCNFIHWRTSILRGLDISESQNFHTIQQFHIWFTLLHWLIVTVNLTQPRTAWDRSINGDLPRYIGPWACLWEIGLIFNWCRMRQPIMNSTIP